MIEPLPLSAVRLCTFLGARQLTNASGFLFERGARLYVVTSGHVLHDRASRHHPDRVEIELHTDSENLARSTGFSMLLYRDRKSVWRSGRDGGGEIDVAALEIERDALPEGTVYRAFTAAHVPDPEEVVELGTSLLVVGFPLGFHDTLHHMPVARQAIVASSFGLRFQGKGYFLTDARTHRGTSGAPVVSRIAAPTTAQAALPWRLLGVHSARLEAGSRDLELDEALGLNCAWYSDILLKLTEEAGGGEETA